MSECAGNAGYRAAGRWHDPPSSSPAVIGSGSTLPPGAHADISAAVAREECRGLLDLDVAGPLPDVAGDTFSFGLSSAGEAMRALTTLATKNSVSENRLTTWPVFPYGVIAMAVGKP